MEVIGEAMAGVPYGKRAAVADALAERFRMDRSTVNRIAKRRSPAHARFRKYLADIEASALATRLAAERAQRILAEARAALEAQAR